MQLKKPTDMTFWERAIVRSARYLPGARCPMCTKPLDLYYIDDNLDDAQTYGFDPAQLEVLWLTFYSCCSPDNEKPTLMVSWDAIVVAFWKSIFGDRFD